jgi:hypothetical protein
VTAEELRAIRERCEKATPGPWEWFEEKQEHMFEGEQLWRYGVASGSEHSVVCMTPMASEIAAGSQVDDVDFIARAREDVPALLAEIDRLNGLLTNKSARTPLLPLGPLARLLGVTSNWLRAEALAGLLPHVVADKTILFDADLVERLLAERARRFSTNGAV